MTVSAQPLRTRFAWLANQPYLLLSLTALFWAGNAIVGRVAAGHIPPSRCRSCAGAARS